MKRSESGTSEIEVEWYIVRSLTASGCDRGEERESGRQETRRKGGGGKGGRMNEIINNRVLCIAVVEPTYQESVRALLTRPFHRFLRNR